MLSTSYIVNAFGGFRGYEYYLTVILLIFSIVFRYCLDKVRKNTEAQGFQGYEFPRRNPYFLFNPAVIRLISLGILREIVIALWERSMIKQLSMFAVATAVLVGIGQPKQVAIAYDCVYQCGSNDIQFLPGQPLTLEIINHTQSQVNLERVLDFNPYSMRPNQTIFLETTVGGQNDLSVVFWEKDYKPVDVRLHRPDTDTLQIEFLPSGSYGDRAVHVVNDGRVLIY